MTEDFLKPNAKTAFLYRQAIIYVNFQKFYGGPCPRTPPRAFIFSISFKIFLPEKLRFKDKSNLGTPSLKKFLNTPQT